jgi:hypothetical protein
MSLLKLSNSLIRANRFPKGKNRIMSNSGQILRSFYEAAIKRDMATARSYLSDDLVFEGLFETYPNADKYIETFTGLLQITVRLTIKTIIAEGDQAAIFFELETKAPVEAVTLVAEWHQFKNGKISHVESAFDGRPFAALFAGR